MVYSINRHMKCAVITPIGPGHERLFHECNQSVHAAIKYSKGPFDEISAIVIDDTSGSMGRSAARNEGVRRANSAHVQWLFFLDADDLLFTNAFDLVKQYVNEFDAVWGAIVELLPNYNRPTLRVPQIVTIQNIKEILLFDPYFTLQMGHFVRAEVALNNPFNEEMNTGEDFDYYLRVWSKHRCIKINQPLFINRRGMHSTGPRSANGRDWRVAVEHIMDIFKMEYNLSSLDKETLEIISNKTLEFAGFARQNKIANHENYLQLTKYLPYFGCYTINCYECPSFRMLSNNDDLTVSSIIWTGSYEPISMSIWAKLAGSAEYILDIGSYTGIYGLVASIKNKKSRIICIEPLDTNCSRIKENILLNSLTNTNILPIAAANDDGEIEVNIFDEGNLLPFVSSIKFNIEKKPISCRKVKSSRIDTVVELEDIDMVSLVKIDVNGSEPAVVEGMKKTIEKRKPDFIMAVSDAKTANYLTDFFNTFGYRFYEISEKSKNLRKTNVMTAGISMMGLNYLITAKPNEELRSVMENIGIHLLGFNSEELKSVMDSNNHDGRNYIKEESVSGRIASFSYRGKGINFFISNPSDLIQRSYLYGNFFESAELEFIADNVRPKSVIIEVGANIGNHAVYFEKFMDPEKVILIEPNPNAIQLLKINLEINNCIRTDISMLGIGVGKEHSRFTVRDLQLNNLGAAYLEVNPEGAIEVVPLDELIINKIDFIKIDVEKMEIDVLQGAQGIIASYRPDIYIEIMNENISEFQKFLKKIGYIVKKQFNYVNAINYYIVPHQ
jgi:FkbM family methyltransferase